MRFSLVFLIITMNQNLSFWTDTLHVWVLTKWNMEENIFKPSYKYILFMTENILFLIFTLIIRMFQGTRSQNSKEVFTMKNVHIFNKMIFWVIIRISSGKCFVLFGQDNLLDQLGTARFFTALELTNGYWQIPSSPESRGKAASTECGLYQFVAILFSSFVAPATWTRFCIHRLQTSSPIVIPGPSICSSWPESPKKGGVGWIREWNERMEKTTTITSCPHLKT